MTQYQKYDFLTICIPSILCDISPLSTGEIIILPLLGFLGFEEKYAWTNIKLFYIFLSVSFNKVQLSLRFLL